MPYHTFIYFIALMISLFITQSFYAANSLNPTLDKQRRLFQQAEQHLKKSRLQSFKKNLKKLTHYPLYPYLRYQELIRQLQLGLLPNSEIKHFLSQYKNTIFHRRLHRQWMIHLYNKKWWKTLTKYYQPATKSTAMQCRYLWARYQLNNQQQSINAFKKVWLQGRSLPKVCDRLISALRKHKQLTSALAWQRITLAMQKRNYQLASYLARFLSNQDKKALTLWRILRRHPEKITKASLMRAASDKSNYIANDTFLQLAKRKPERAVTIWPRLKNKFSLTQQQKTAITKSIALHLALKKSSKTASWMKKIPNQDQDLTLASWNIRTALYQQRWQHALTLINTLPPHEYDSHLWQYWKARALEQLGQIIPAKKVYKRLAKHRNYYGFLASNKLQQPYQLNRKAVNISKHILKSVSKQPGIRRAYEFKKTGHPGLARSEWVYAINQLTETEKLAAAKLAHDWGWYNLSVLTTTKTKHRDDLKLRFPMAHYRTILHNAKRYKISPAWVFSVARQESIFHEHAYSPVGARGIMQLMPTTARYIARKIQIRHYTSKLLDANHNIALGTAYLKRLLERYDNRLILALAAYNAGISRVNQWLPEKKSIAADLWIETIPYKETRSYIKNILAYTVVYNARLGHAAKMAQQLVKVPTLKQIS
ncbi:transglycosylase SLT domain-containing protein [Piscirickettsia salmonis]|uniref:transglycosylase SLT domain-containing protein n=1 Tax=Piscirickettsia salmonis TaxID=1238 RepID=UPI0007C9098E|nr:Soluble lytic murein transglycosylase precursor [Piscirickettsiaceae bacterium NZ-RLO1]